MAIVALLLSVSALALLTRDVDSALEQPLTASFSPVGVPKDGTIRYGVQWSWVQDSPSGYARRLGLRPAQYARFLDWPFGGPDHASLAELDKEVAEVGSLGSDFFLTVDPHLGLDWVTPARATELALMVRDWNERHGVAFYIRFAHEMNGSWYSWGQQPQAYVKAFRVVAAAVHRLAPGNVMVWSPNYGEGYPYPNGQYSARPTTVAFETLDTDEDGELTIKDDPYSPYYPGDQYVDWVGLTLYYHGEVWPWRENESPGPDRFIKQLRGEYKSVHVDETMLPDFYGEYAVKRGKPMAIAETAAFFNVSLAGEGAPEYTVKSNWMAQVFSTEVPRLFPKLKMINWFEHVKEEPGLNGVGSAPETIDWRVTGQRNLLETLKADLLQGPFLFAGDDIIAPSRR